jgi:hypothetical protein
MRHILDITKMPDGRCEGSLAVPGTAVRHEFAGLLELLAIFEQEVRPGEHVTAEARPGQPEQDARRAVAHSGHRRWLGRAGDGIGGDMLVADQCHVQPCAAPQQAEQDEVHDPVEGVEGCGDQAARQDQQRRPRSRAVEAVGPPGRDAQQGQPPNISTIVTGIAAATLVVSVPGRPDWPDLGYRRGDRAPSRRPCRSAGPGAPAYEAMVAHQ